MRYLYTLIFTLTAIAGHSIPQTITDNIHVDQFGYLNEGRKIAVLSDPMSGYNAGESYTPGNAFELRDWFSDAVVFSGAPVAWNNGLVHSQSGDKCWWFDFSDLQVTGSYYVHDADNNVSSGRFEIGPCVYGDVMKQALRVFFYQRCGMAKSTEYAGSAWADGPCHLGAQQDVHCKPYNDPAGEEHDLRGGWHDAGDYNKYVNFTLEPMLDLMDAYERNPSLWTDDFDVPESGNGIADILDEIKYELDWLLRMQNGDGGVLCIVGATNYNTSSPPSADGEKRVHGPATTSASFTAAALFARAAAVFSGAFSDQLKNAALLAWTWGNAHPGVTFYNSGVIVSGEQELSSDEAWARKFIAAVYLWKLTGAGEYKDYVDAHYAESHMMQWGYVYPFENAIQNALLAYAASAGADPVVSADIQDTYIQSVQSWNEDNWMAYEDQMDPYGAFLRSENYTWGSHTTKSRVAHIFQNMMYYGFNLLDGNAYDLAAEGFVHYFHGVNPNGVCFLTNMGPFGAERSCNSIYHGWFTDGSALWDEVGTSVHGPPPGYVPGGVNPTYDTDGCCPNGCGSAQANSLCDPALVTPPLGQPVQKSWRDWNAGWPQNSWTLTEPGIYTQAAYIKMLAEFLPDGCLELNSVHELPGRETALRLSPNPCDGELAVDASWLSPGPGSFSVYNYSGRKILAGDVENGSGKSALLLDVSGLVNGIYFLRVESRGAVRAGRFVVGRK